MWKQAVLLDVRRKQLGGIGGGSTTMRINVNYLIDDNDGDRRTHRSSQSGEHPLSKGITSPFQDASMEWSIY